MPSLSCWFSRGIRFGRPAERRRSCRPAVEPLDPRDLPAVTVLPVSGLEALQNTPFSSVVAEFRESAVGVLPPATILANLQATINWGDGHTIDGTITGPDALGNFLVSGSNTYLDAQRFQLSVTVRDGNDHTFDVVSTIIPVKPVMNPALPFAATGQSIQADSGQAFAGVVAAFTDPNPNAVPGKLRARIDWGDGSVPELASIAPIGNGHFEVRGSHVYASAGSYSVSATIQDSNLGRTTATSATAVVAATPDVFALTGVNFNASTGLPFGGVVAVLRDSDVHASTANLSATINWGDGSPLDTGTLQATATPGFFEVLGRHPYLLSGSDQVQVWVRDNSNARAATTSGTATIGDSPNGALTVTAVDVTASPGVSYSGVVGVVHDSDAGALMSNLTAVINWGDGSFVQIAQLQETGARGFFEIVGSHTYSLAGSSRLSVWVQDNSDGRLARDRSSVTVAQTAATPPPPAPTPVRPPARPASPPPAIVVSPGTTFFAVPETGRRHRHHHHRARHTVRVFRIPLFFT